ncbi:MAG: rhodanese-like domain-containing protein [Microbacteriaceae bacterium]|nr:rhodanese-like domain-containing protein [Microbacteriaceae bacterium]
MPAEITATDALAEVTAGTLLLDVREPAEWDRGHSPLAISLPMSELQARLDEVPENTRVLVVCHSGQRSARVTAALNEAGYTASNVIGGMVAWEQAGGVLVAAAGDNPRVD